MISLSIWLMFGMGFCVGFTAGLAVMSELIVRGLFAKDQKPPPTISDWDRHPCCGSIYDWHAPWCGER